MDDKEMAIPKPLAADGTAHEQRLGFLIYRAGLAVARGYERALKPIGVMPVEAGVLTSLHHGGPNHVRGLARQLGVGRQTIVNVTRALEQRSWIERRTSSDDGRLTIFSITTTGKNRLSEVEMLATAFDGQLREVIGQDHEATIIRHLQHVLGAAFLAHED
jgi:DNA-binding MarR family transcriptional regulator